MTDKKKTPGIEEPNFKSSNIEVGGKTFDEKSLMRSSTNNEILDMGGVVSTHVQYKTVKGRKTKQRCLVVGVEKKKPLDEIDPKDVVPKKLKDGTPTDVVEIGTISARPAIGDGDNPNVDYNSPDRNLGETLSCDTDYYTLKASQGTPVGGGCGNRTYGFKPLIGGISFGSDIPLGHIFRPNRRYPSSGTLGAIVKDSTNDALVALTNNHVLGIVYNKVNSKIPTFGTISAHNFLACQPSWRDGWRNSEDHPYGEWGWRNVDYVRRVGLVKRVHPIKFGTDNNQYNLIDAGITTVPIDYCSTEIYGIHQGPFPFAEKDEYSEGDFILKSGRSTGLVPTPITSIGSTDYSSNVNYHLWDDTPTDKDVGRFHHQIMLTSDTEYMVLGGDSGQVVVCYTGNVYKIIGLLFAGSSNGTVAVVNHIKDVERLLQVEQWDGDIKVAKDDSRASTWNRRSYFKDGSKKLKDVTHVADYRYADCTEASEPVTVTWTDSYVSPTWTQYGILDMDSYRSLIEIVPNNTPIQKSLVLWFDRMPSSFGWPQARRRIYDVRNDAYRYRITDIKFTVSCFDGNFTSQTDQLGQEIVDEKWVNVVAPRGSLLRSTDDTDQSWDNLPDLPVYSEVSGDIGGGFENIGDYIELQEMYPGTGRLLNLTIDVPSDATTKGIAYVKLSIQCNVVYDSTSSISSSSKSNSSWESSFLSISSSSSSNSSESSFSISSESSQSSSSESSSADSKSSSSSSSESSCNGGVECTTGWGLDLTEFRDYDQSNPTDDSIDGSKCFDGVLSGAYNQWIASSGGLSLPAWVEVDFNTNVIIEKLRMYCLDASYGPKSIQLKASGTGAFSGEEITILDKPNLTIVSENWKEWVFVNTNNLQYYRLYVTDVQTSGSLIITELEMYSCSGDQSCSSVSSDSSSISESSSESKASKSSISSESSVSSVSSESSVSSVSSESSDSSSSISSNSSESSISSFSRESISDSSLSFSSCSGIETNCASWSSDLTGLATITVSDYEGANNGINLVDNNSSSFWRLYYPDINDWVQLEFPSSRKLNRIAINCNTSSGPRNFKFYGSSTGDFAGEHVELYSFEGSISGLTNFDFTNHTKYKYYRIRPLTFSSAISLVVFEIEAYECTGGFDCSTSSVSSESFSSSSLSISSISSESSVSSQSSQSSRSSELSPSSMSSESSVSSSSSDASPSSTSSESSISSISSESSSSSISSDSSESSESSTSSISSESSISSDSSISSSSSWDGSNIYEPAANGDDGYCWDGGSGFNTSLNYMYIGDANVGGSQHAFIRFPNITIPNGATIDSAYLKVTARSSDSSTPCDVNIGIETEDNPTAPTLGSDLIARSTGTTVDWDPVPSFSAGSTYNTPSIASILETHVARAGWASGNALIVIIRDNGTGSNQERRPATYNHTSYNPIQLIVTYTES